MMEVLAIPASGAPPIGLDRWIECLAGLGHRPTTTREGPAAAWIEVPALRLRGYVVFEHNHPEAINFELHAPDPSAALELVEHAARELGWEIHPDDGDEEPDD